MSKNKPKTTGPPSKEAIAFTALTKRLLAVPKSEVAEKKGALKQQNKRQA